MIISSLKKNQMTTMHCSLVEVSDELHLKVIHELLKHDQLLHDKSIEPDPHQDNQDRDDEFQYHPDLMNWSCTSRYFRNLLAPYIFREIKLRNDEKSGASVAAVLKGPYGDLVKEIYFLGDIPPGMADPYDKYDDDEPLPEGFHKVSDEAEEEESVTVTLPPVVDNLLSNLDQSPNLQSLSIGFTYPYDDPFDEYYEAEGIGEYEILEAARALRTLITTTYETLMRNKVPQFGAVEIRKFVWTFTKPYESQKFHEFLSHVKHFSLSIRGGDNGAGWGVNTCDGYLECVARLDELFFDHLASAVSLNLQAPDRGPIGLEGMRHARLALKRQQMPLLKSLRLEYIFICQELADFVASHADTLERLTLHECNSSVSSVVGLQENEPFYWSHFFDALHGADLKQLSHLEIWPYNVPLTLEAMDHDADSVPTERAEPDNVQQIRQVINTHNTRRVFAYATLDDKYGYLFGDDEENQAAFERGEDQVAFDRLMANVNANAAKGAVNPLGE